MTKFNVTKIKIRYGAVYIESNVVLGTGEKATYERRTFVINTAHIECAFITPEVVLIYTSHYDQEIPLMFGERDKAERFINALYDIGLNRQAGIIDITDEIHVKPGGPNHAANQECCV